MPPKASVAQARVVQAPELQQGTADSIKQKTALRPDSNRRCPRYSFKTLHFESRRPGFEEMSPKFHFVKYFPCK